MVELGCHHTHLFSHLALFFLGFCLCRTDNGQQHSCCPILPDVSTYLPSTLYYVAVAKVWYLCTTIPTYETRNHKKIMLKERGNQEEIEHAIILSMGSRSGTKKSFGKASHRPVKVSVSAIILIIVYLFTMYGFCIGLNRKRNNDYVIGQNNVVKNGESSITAVVDSDSGSGPTIHSLDDLSPEELHPKANSHRHIVSPPPDDKPISLVTCETTAGYVHIVAQ